MRATATKSGSSTHKFQPKVSRDTRRRHDMVRAHCTCGPQAMRRASQRSLNSSMSSSDGEGASRLCPQCLVVHRELHEVERAVAQGPTHTRTAPAATATLLDGRASVKDNTALMSPPYRADMLTDGLRLQAAAAWLAQCPLPTLQTLQQRVLCASEELFCDYAGLPAELRAHIALPTPPRAEDEPPAPLKALPFSTFLSTYVATAPAGPGLPRGLLPAGRPAPVAPLGSSSLPYGAATAEAALCHDGGAGTYADVERDQALMSDLAQWSAFFAAHLDPARAGAAQEPASLSCAVLLACARADRRCREAGTPAQLRDAVATLQRGADSRSHARTCAACGAHQEHLRHYCEYYYSVAAAPQPPRVRFFLGTPALVLWIEYFLSAHRRAHDPEGTLLSGEAFLIRDWIRQEAADDGDGWAEQASDGCCRVPTGTLSVRKVRVTAQQAAEACRQLTQLAEAAVAANKHVPAGDVLRVLQETLPITIYYFSFFSGPKTGKN